MPSEACQYFGQQRLLEGSAQKEPPSNGHPLRRSQHAVPQGTVSSVQLWPEMLATMKVSRYDRVVICIVVAPAAKGMSVLNGRVAKISVIC
jgi:hypothetical protein